MLTTTLNLLRKAGACEDRYKYLLTALGGPSIDHDAPIPLTRILDINGLDDCLWALRATPTEQDAAAWAVARDAARAAAKDALRRILEEV